MYIGYIRGGGGLVRDDDYIPDEKHLINFLLAGLEKELGELCLMMLLVQAPAFSTSSHAPAAQSSPVYVITLMMLPFTAVSLLIATLAQ